MSKLEVRTFDTEIRMDADTNTIHGYASVFNSSSRNLGGFIERVSPTAFDRSLASGKDVVARYNHNDDKLLGRTSSGTLKLTKDDKGLRYEVSLPDTSYARDLKALMQRGDVNKSSFAFRCNSDSWGTDPDTGMDLRTLDDVDLVDVSPVNTPAYDASSSGLRSIPASAPAEVRSRIEARMAANECDCPCEACAELDDCTLCDNDDCDDDGCIDCGTGLPTDDGDGDVEANSLDQPTDTEKKYIKKISGHKDSQGNLAEWCVISKETGDVIASYSSKKDAYDGFAKMMSAKFGQNSDNSVSELRTNLVNTRASILTDLLQR